MLIECCSQERSYLRFYGLLGQRLCLLNQIWVEKFDEAFQQQVQVKICVIIVRIKIVMYMYDVHCFKLCTATISLPIYSTAQCIAWKPTNSAMWLSSSVSCSTPMPSRGPACRVSISTKKRPTHPAGYLSRFSSRSWRSSWA